MYCLQLPEVLTKANTTLKEINPECAPEGPILKLQYFDHLMQRTNSLKENLMLGKTKGTRRM